jgi:hypothetical protein
MKVDQVQNSYFFQDQSDLFREEYRKLRNEAMELVMRERQRAMVETYMTLGQGCQIFLASRYQNGEKLTK